MTVPPVPPASPRTAWAARLLAVVALALGATTLTGSGPALAAACSGTSGVTVVVDFGSSVVTACAPGDPASGLAALTAAGFSVTQVQRYPGAVCRIDGSPANDPCVSMPPSNAYWAYFHAQRGGSWSYSQQGAGAYDPAPGSVEGWSFGSGSAPTTAPPAASSSKPTSSASTGGRPAATSTSSSRTRSGASPGVPAARPTAGARPATGSSQGPGAGSTTSSGGAPSPTSGGTHGATSTVTPTATASSSGTATGATTGYPGSQALGTGSGAGATGPSGAGPTSLLSLLVGGGLVTLLGGAAAYLAWRRRATA